MCWSHHFRWNIDRYLVNVQKTSVFMTDSLKGFFLYSGLKFMPIYCHDVCSLPVKPSRCKPSDIFVSLCKRANISHNR